MATKYQMQAKSSADGLLHSWLVDVPDFAGAFYTGGGTPSDIALSSGGFATPEVDTDGFIVNASGAFLLNASGAQLISDRPTIVNDSGATLVNASGATLLVG